MQIKSTVHRENCLPVHTLEKGGSYWPIDLMWRRGILFPHSGKTLTVRLAITPPPYLQLQPPLIPNCVLNLLSNGPKYATFPSARYVFGFLFHFNRGEIGNIFFYSPLAPLESLLSFGLFMKNYFMLTYICRLFSPSVTCSRFSSILKALKPILYVCRSAFSIESRLKYQCAVGKVWQEETNSLLLCRGL